MTSGVLSVTTFFHLTFLTSAVTTFLSLLLIWQLRKHQALARSGDPNAANSLIYPIYESILWAFVILGGSTCLLLGAPGPYPKPASWFVVGNYLEAPREWQLSAFYFAYWFLFEVLAEGFGLLFLHPGPSKAAFITTLQYAVLYGAFAAGLTTVGFNYSKLGLSQTTQMTCDSVFIFAPCLLYLILLFSPGPIPRRVAVHPYALFSLSWRTISVIALNSGVLGTLVGGVLIIYRTVGLPVAIYLTLTIDTRHWQRLGTSMIGNFDVVAIAKGSYSPKASLPSSPTRLDGDDCGDCDDDNRDSPHPHHTSTSTARLSFSSTGGDDTDGDADGTGGTGALLSTPEPSRLHAEMGSRGSSALRPSSAAPSASRRQRLRLVMVSPEGLVRDGTAVRASSSVGPGHGLSDSDEEPLSSSSASRSRRRATSRGHPTSIPDDTAQLSRGLLVEGEGGGSGSGGGGMVEAGGDIEQGQPSTRVLGRLSAKPIVHRRVVRRAKPSTSYGTGSGGGPSYGALDGGEDSDDADGTAEQDYVYSVIRGGDGRGAALGRSGGDGGGGGGRSSAGRGAGAGRAGAGGGGAGGGAGGSLVSHDESSSSMEIACVRDLKRENQAHLIHFGYLKKGRELDEGGSSVVYAGEYSDWTTVEDPSASGRRRRPTSSSVSSSASASPSSQRRNTTNGRCILRQVAIKQFTPKRGLTDEVVAKYHIEHRISAAFHHPNIVRYFGLCVDPPCISLVFELCERGSLHALLQRASLHRESLGWHHKLRMAGDGAKALAYLHSFDPPYLHRDIKSPNFLVTSSWDMKLSDFGESRLLETRESHQTGLVGTPAWMAPEMMGRKSYTEKVDIYSFGIVLWEILTEQMPFDGLHQGQVFQLILIDDDRPYISEDVAAAHPEMVDLICRCWSTEPEDRPSADEVVAAIDEMVGVGVI